MPLPDHSAVMVFTRLTSPAFAAPYDAWPAAERMPSIDVTQTIEPGASRAISEPRHLARGDEEVAEVAAVVEVPDLGGHVGEPRPRGHADDGDQAVERAQLRSVRGDRGDQRVVVGDVDDDGQRAVAPASIRRDPLGPFGLEVGDGDVGAGGGEQRRRASPMP